MGTLDGTLVKFAAEFERDGGFDGGGGGGACLTPVSSVNILHYSSLQNNNNDEQEKCEANQQATHRDNCG